ncbi:MAG: hypothetical protein GWN81_26580, partial [Phycisphaerae bacterium]|nr:hypothetical protein [Phycisphaerae bacterium]
PVVAISKGEIGLGDVERVLQDNSLDISPVTDDSPFFYKFEEGIPLSVTLVLWTALAMFLLIILVPIVYFRKHASYRDAKPKNKLEHKSLFRFVL